MDCEIVYSGFLKWLQINNYLPYLLPDKYIFVFHPTVFSLKNLFFLFFFMGNSNFLPWRPATVHYWVSLQGLLPSLPLCTSSDAESFATANSKHPGQAGSDVDTWKDLPDVHEEKDLVAENHMFVV